MRKKLNLIVSLSTFCLAIAVLCFGVFAAIKVTYTVSGSISYEVTDAHVDISTTVYYSASKMTEGELYKNIQEIEDKTTDLSTLKTVHEVSTTGQEVDDYVFNNTTALADLKFDSEHKTYFFSMNVTNRGANNIWAIVEDDISSPANTLQANNAVQQTIGQNQTKPIIFAVTIDDETVSITLAEDTAFNYSIKVGVGDVSQQDFNLQKLGFTLNEDTYTVTVPTDLTKAVGTVIIPKTYNGKQVTTIANPENTMGGAPMGFESVFKDCNYETIVVQNNISTLQSGVFGKITAKQLFVDSTIINASTFVYNLNLVAIKLSNVEVIGSYLFYGCNNLVLISLPSSLMKIGANAFDDTQWFDCLTVDSNGLKIVYSSDNVNVKFLIGAVYENLPEDGIITADMLTGIKTINTYSFDSCSNLKSISIPSSVTSIGHSAFFGCYNLEEVTFMHTNGAIEIGYNAFGGCSNGMNVRFATETTKWTSGSIVYTGQATMSGLFYSTNSNEYKTWTITSA